MLPKPSWSVASALYLLRYSVIRRAAKLIRSVPFATHQVGDLKSSKEPQNIIAARCLVEFTSRYVMQFYLGNKCNLGFVDSNIRDEPYFSCIFIKSHLGVSEALRRPPLSRHFNKDNKTKQNLLPSTRVRYKTKRVLAPHHNGSHTTTPSAISLLRIG